MPHIDWIKRPNPLPSPFHHAKSLAILAWEVAGGIVVWVLICIGLMEG